jgi:hypothetical protein
MPPLPTPSGESTLTLPSEDLPVQGAALGQDLPAQGAALGASLVTLMKENQAQGRATSKEAIRVQLMNSTLATSTAVGAVLNRPFFLPMLHRVFENKLRPAKHLATALEALSEEDGVTIGAALAAALATNLSADAGLNEWIEAHPALKELNSTQAWFRPMMSAVALHLMISGTFGASFRLFFGASLSMTTLGSDVVVIVEYSLTGRAKDAMALIAMIVISLVLQMLIVWIKNRKSKNLLKEFAIVLSGVKPGVDAHRVASQQDGLYEKSEETDAFDTHTELVCIKVCEVAAEAIPGVSSLTPRHRTTLSYHLTRLARAQSILQTYVMLNSYEEGKSISATLMASLLISALTSGFTTAVIAYDYDVSPIRRKLEPAMYGYIPSGKISRSLIFLNMVLNGAVLLLLRSAGEPKPPRPPPLARFPSSSQPYPYTPSALCRGGHPDQPRL